MPAWGGGGAGRKQCRIPLLNYIQRWNEYTETGDEEIAVAMWREERPFDATPRTAVRSGTCDMSVYARVGGVDVAELAALKPPRTHTLQLLGDLEWPKRWQWAVHVEAAELAAYLSQLRRHPSWCDEAADGPATGTG
eukprot:gene20024-22369_t